MQYKHHRNACNLGIITNHTEAVNYAALILTKTNYMLCREFASPSIHDKSQIVFTLYYLLFLPFIINRAHTEKTHTFAFSAPLISFFEGFWLLSPLFTHWQLYSHLSVIELSLNQPASLTQFKYSYLIKPIISNMLYSRGQMFPVTNKCFCFLVYVCVNIKWQQTLNKTRHMLHVF